MAKSKTQTARHEGKGHDGTVAVNRRASYDYFLEDRYEAGLALTGTEVKSLRAGHANLREAYVRIQDGEAWLWNAHISPYEQGNRYNHEPTRNRKLLLHAKEIRQLAGIVKREGYTLVPLRVYFKNNRAKVEVAVARGKKAYDKRDVMAERDARREIERALADRRRG
jgi:SsrA-binding protein